MNLIQKIAVWALPVLFAITAHEAAHAYIAKQFGDKTAWMLGRCSFNPVKHIDLFGTVLLPALCLLLPGGFVFGWAKPVPVNIWNLRNPKRDMLWVAAAGPIANLIMAILWALLFRLSHYLDGTSLALPLSLMGQAGIIINISLMALNLIPLPPLDGGRIVISLLPRQLANAYARVEPYGMYILIALMLTKVLGLIMSPLVALGYGLVGLLF